MSLVANDDSAAPWTLLEAVDGDRHRAIVEIVRNALPASFRAGTVDALGRKAHGQPLRVEWRQAASPGEIDWRFTWLSSESSESGATRSDDAEVPGTPRPARHRGYVRSASDGTNVRLLESHVIVDEVDVAHVAAPSAAGSGVPDRGAALGSDALRWQGLAVDLGVTRPSPAASEPTSVPVARDEDVRSLQEQADDTPYAIAAHTHGYFRRDIAVVDRWQASRKVLDPTQLTAIVDYLEHGGARFDMRGWNRADWAGATGVRSPLAFYRGYSLVEIDGLSGVQGPGVLRIVLRTELGDGPICVLDGTSQPLSVFNAALRDRDELSLGPEHRADYVFFFCLLVEANDGPLWIVEEATDLTWKGGDGDAAERDALARFVHPMQELLAPDPDSRTASRYTAFASVGCDVFYVSFTVFENGDIRVDGATRCFAGLDIVSTRDLRPASMPLRTETALMDFRFAPVTDSPKATRSDAISEPAFGNAARDAERTDEVASLFERRGIVNFAFPLQHQHVGIPKVFTATTELPFYPGFSLIQVTDRRGLYAQSAFAIMALGDVDTPACFLGRSADVLAAFNAKLHAQGKLRIDEETAADYLKFYFQPYVQASDHRYSIVDRPSDLRWSFEQGADDIRPVVVSLLERPRLLVPLTSKLRSTANLYCAAVVVLQRTIFRATFRIEQTGAVELLSAFHVVERRQAGPLDGTPVDFQNVPLVPSVWDERSQQVLRSVEPRRSR